MSACVEAPGEKSKAVASVLSGFGVLSLLVSKKEAAEVSAEHAGHSTCQARISKPSTLAKQASEAQGFRSKLYEAQTQST